MEGALEDGSKADRLLARYMLDSWGGLPFENAASIARSVKVSEATVGRFCRSIGYSSFRDLKDHLKHDMGDEPWLMSDRLHEMRKGGGADSAQLNQGLQLEIAALVGIYELAGSREWQQEAERLAQTSHVFVAGFQTERGLAQYFANQMQYVRDGVTLLDLAGGNFAEVLLTNGPAHLVIFEARRYSVLSKSLAEEARTAGVTVTLITDVFCDWGYETADQVFAVPTQFNQFWDSTAQMANLSNLLIHSVFLKLGTEVDTRLNRIADLYGRFTGHVDRPARQGAKRKSDTEKTNRSENDDS
nr:MurR/RpiR family transcriptional regulator [Pseudophaeobacter flagellatus]